MLYNSVLNESKRIDREIATIESKVEKLPHGKLQYKRNGKYVKWYQTVNGKKEYIAKENSNLVERLALYKYFSLLLEDLKCQGSAITTYLNKCNPSNQKAQALLNSSPEYAAIITKYYALPETELEEWKSAEYETNTLHPEQLIHKNASGNIVRSKSEALIDMELTLNQIPFRYECALHLGDYTFYPDFTIKHSETEEIFYWEHFGLIDDYSYAKNAYSKLLTYSTNGVIPTINLITTYETREKPLTSDKIEEIINLYFK